MRKTIDLGNLMQNVHNALLDGKASSMDGEDKYIADVKQRVPKIEQALQKVKKYLDQISQP
ncbi:hypothetical protein [Bacillus sp. OTU530]|uniref:hypothetical protein n=1 Tax=Bacillus sp. OTU530 TaxID=3043862 RepID=UPI00313AACB9